VSGDLILLSVVSWLHLVATVVWLGAMVTNILVLVPTAREVLEPQVMGRFLGSFMKRFRPIVYVSITALTITGGIMTLLNKLYLGAFAIGNLWTQLLVVKHILIVILIVGVIYSFEVLAHRIGRLAAAGPSPQLAQLQKLQVRLSFAGLVTAMIVLLLTSIITAM